MNWRGKKMMEIKNPLTEKELEMVNKGEITFYMRDHPFGWLSNFERSLIEIDGVIYPTVEHYYQSQKALEPATQYWIANAPKPYMAMIAGRGLRENELNTMWPNVKMSIMTIGIMAKFTQNTLLRSKLLATKEAEIHEDSPTDMFWGMKGEDKLGTILTRVRGQLRIFDF